MEIESALELTVLKQLEFYFDDDNLIKDKFLTNLLKQNKYIKLETLLNFNKIKQLVQAQPNPLQILQNAIRSSKILKLGESELEVKRKKTFETTDQKLEEIDQRTIYIENLPNNIDHQKLYEVFSNIGEIKHVSLPSVKKTKKRKGYGFIVFQQIQSVQLAIQKYDNTIPSQFFFENSQKQQALKIYTKSVWLQYKQQFKQIKLEIKQQSYQQPLQKVIQQETILLKITNIPIKSNKFEFKVLIKQISNPKYIEFKGEYAILRFDQHSEAEHLINRFSQFPVELNGQTLSIDRMQDQEANNYIEIMQKNKENFKNYLKEKKKKIKIE